MSTPDIAKLVNIPANIASLVAVHAQATAAIEEHADNHRERRYLARRKLHAENMMKEDVKKGDVA